MKKYLKLIVLPALIILASCEKAGTNTLTVSITNIQIPGTGGKSSFIIQTDADSWSIENPASGWISLSSSSGQISRATVYVDVDSRSLTARQETLVVKAGNAAPVSVTVSQDAAEYLYNLSADKLSFSYNHSSNTGSLTITTDAPRWHLSCNAGWLQLSKQTGNKGTSNVNLNIGENAAIGERIAVMILSADSAQPVEIAVKQKGTYFPGYNLNPVSPDNSGMGSNAAQLASKIKIGWNIGNSLEAIGGETNWGNPAITNELIQLVKQSGFNAIRLPCSWNQYSDPNTAEISKNWLNRVKEVVQYCVDNDMYVLLNIHWDGGWLENNCTSDKQDINNARLKAFWEQIATALRDFDEHLLFAGTNEPNVDQASQMEVLLSYHQTFINAVRSTGGRNAYRILVVQGPSTDIGKTHELMNQMPVDNVPDRLMAEIHYYTPWNLCGLTEDASWGNMFFYWGNGYHSETDLAHNATWGEEETVNTNFGLMKQQFVDKGIPVILGEFGAMRRTNLSGTALTLHLASRAYYHKYVTQKAIANGILPFYWDNGGLGNFANGIFDRNNLTVFDQQTLNALMEGANQK
jgi:aryl-phospho-beta-D-glucosidase BglC (GH1 family)